jgi:hypothetical protein
VDTRPTATFPAYFWRPGPARGQLRARGFRNAVMLVYPGRIVIRPGRIERFIAPSVPEEIDYQWPVIILQSLKPLGLRAFLIDVGGMLGSCKPHPLDRATAAIRDAGFEIITTSARGREEPKAVSRNALGARASSVPRSILGDEAVVMNEG